MSDIFREVDEELRQDQFKTLWKKYGWMIIAVVVIAIGGVGGKQAWDAYQQDKAYQLSDRYASAMQAVETADLERAQSQFESLAAGGSGHALLARFQQAGLLAEQGDIEGAVAALQQLESDAGADSPLGQLAAIQSILLRLDDGEPSALEAEVQPFLQEGNPFRPAALEISGLLALKQGDLDGARQQFSALAEAQDASVAMRQRASQILTALGE